MSTIPTTPATPPAPITGSAGNAVADTSRRANADNMKAATQKFEAIFIGMMLKSMRATKLGDDVLGSSAIEKFRDVQDDKLAQNLSVKMPLGLGKALGDFLTRNQPALSTSQPNPSTTAKDG